MWFFCLLLRDIPLACVSPKPCQEYISQNRNWVHWQIEIDSIKVLWGEVTLPGREEDRGVKLMRGRVGKSATGTNDSQVLSACMSPWIHIPGRSSYQHVQVPCAPLGCWCTCMHKVNMFWDGERLVFWVRKGCSEPRVALQTVAVWVFTSFHFWIHMSFFFLGLAFMQYYLLWKP